jgi:hypothetical protein
MTFFSAAKNPHTTPRLGDWWCSGKLGIATQERKRRQKQQASMCDFLLEHCPDFLFALC